MNDRQTPDELSSRDPDAERDLKRWMSPPQDDLRAHRQWAAIANRLSGGPVGDASADRPSNVRALRRPVMSGRIGVVLAACFALAAVFAGLWIRASHNAKNLANAALASSNVVLADGSQVTLDSGATFAVPTNEAMHVAAVLRSGGAKFEVVPNRERVFTVVAEGVEVRVVGTAFRVDIAAASHDVTVSVVHGIVEVRNASEPGRVRRLFAGQAWSTHDLSASSSASVVDSATPDSPAVDAPAVDSAAVESPSTSGAPSTSSTNSSAAPDPSAATQAPLSASDDARALFESANRARRGGDLTRAAALYRQLCARHPGDPRSQVAALELARIEMDGNGDSSVAEGALKSASSANVGSSVHEDALARLVQLYASKGNQKACVESRTAYLAAYPDGVHVAQVRAACASR